jgi:hypothetical protein
VTQQLHDRLAAIEGQLSSLAKGQRDIFLAVTAQPRIQPNQSQRISNCLSGPVVVRDGAHFRNHVTHYNITLAANPEQIGGLEEEGSLRSLLENVENTGPGRGVEQASSLRALQRSSLTRRGTATTTRSSQYSPTRTGPRKHPTLRNLTISSKRPLTMRTSAYESDKIRMMTRCSPRFGRLSASNRNAGTTTTRSSKEIRKVRQFGLRIHGTCRSHGRKF